MQSHGKIAFVLVILGVVGMAGWRIAEPYLKANTQTEITDANAIKATISIAVDGWVGYFPLCSPEIKKRLRRDGYGLQCIDDSADYKTRFRKLDKNEYDFVVATVDSYVLNGKSFDYPGAIISVLDESKGGDAIVARKSVVASLEVLKAATKTKVAYTPDSPSHHLVKSVASHFDVAVFKDTTAHYHANGSEDAFRALKNRDVDVAVLWEPDVSRALADDEFVRILGTEDTKQLIVDILIASRRTAKNQEEMVLALLKNYFHTLKHYGDNKEVLVRDLAKYVNLSESKVGPLLDGVRWSTLSENAESWYNVSNSSFSEEALIRSIESSVDVLLDNQDFSSHPLPNQDPYRLVNSQYIERLYRMIGNSGGWTNVESQSSTINFASLSDGQWNNLQEVGSLKARKISFASGTAELTEEGKVKIDELIKDLTHYPTFRVEVRGHTGTRGDAQVNIALSQERSDAVLSHMREAHGVSANRVRALGFGGSRPLAKKVGESDRAYRYRLPRVELILVRETI